MSDTVVVDSSVVLAYFLAERWDSKTEPPVQLFRRSLISTVNLTEVITKLVDLDQFALPMISEALQLLHAVPFSVNQATLAGQLRSTTRSSGLSLGDRACLSLAIDQGLEVFTADRPWLTLGLPCKIHLIRT